MLQAKHGKFDYGADPLLYPNIPETAQDISGNRPLGYAIPEMANTICTYLVEGKHSF